MDDRSCPLCKARPPLGPVAVTFGPALWQCRRCAGVWAHADAAHDAARRYGQGHPIMQQPLQAHTCRKCRKSIPREVDHCPACGARQTLACLDCRKPMARVRVKTTVVDLCRPCRSAWLDAGELAQLARWAEEGGRPRTRRRSARRTDAVVDLASPVDVLAEGGVELAVRGTVEAASHLPDAAAAAGEGAMGAWRWRARWWSRWWGARRR